MDPPKKFASADEVTFFSPRQISAYSIFFGCFAILTADKGIAF